MMDTSDPLVIFAQECIAEAEDGETVHVQSDEPERLQSILAKLTADRDVLRRIYISGRRTP